MAAKATARTAKSRSAEGATMAALLPPSSRIARAKRAARRGPTSPIAVEPVAETTEGTPVGPARFWHKGRTFPFYGVYITLDETAKRCSLEDKALVGGNNHGWPANSEGLPARDHRRVSGKRHRMVRLLYLRELGCGLVGQVF